MKSRGRPTLCRTSRRSFRSPRRRSATCSTTSRASAPPREKIPRRPRSWRSCAHASSARGREGGSRADRRPRVAGVEWTDPISPAGHWVPEMVELAGGADGLGRKGAPAQAAAWETLRAYAPEVVVLMPCGFGLERAAAEAPRLERLDGWRELPAVKARRVFAVDGSAYFNRPGPRPVDRGDTPAARPHPEIFPPAPADAARRLA